MNEVLLFVLLCLAAFRLQRIVTTDDWPPSEWFRDKVASRFGEGSAWYTLVTCPWCLSAYTTAALVFVVDRWFAPLRYPVLQYAAILGAVGLLAEWSTE